jgi:hypothetical protein
MNTRLPAETAANRSNHTEAVEADIAEKRRLLLVAYGFVS